jgi:hypothetical protein
MALLRLFSWSISLSAAVVFLRFSYGGSLFRPPYANVKQHPPLAKNRNSVLAALTAARTEQGRCKRKRIISDSAPI